MKTELTESIIKMVGGELDRQYSKWGDQKHPLLDPTLIGRPLERVCEEYEIPSENRAKTLCEINAKRGTLTWMHILVEEVSEVASSQSPEEMTQELVQVMAVCTQMIKELKRFKEELAPSPPADWVPPSPW